MHLLNISVVTLLMCTYFGSAFGFYGLLNSNKLFLNELNTITGLSNASSTTAKWIWQPIDHFNKTDTRRFKMKYFERLGFWKSGGPIYLFISGEAPGIDIFLKTGILYELATETNGAMYASEHRYYGESMPFSDLSTNNLKYLSSRQALADIAQLLKEIKMLSKYKESKVVVVGGSYAGNLAAWLKLLYPEMVDAVIASSAPVLAKKDFYEYFEAVSEDFEQYGTPGCHDAIKKMFKVYDKLFQTEAGIRQLVEEEQICKTNNMSILENKQVFFGDKLNRFVDEAQYGSPESIRDFCVKLKNNSHLLLFKEYSELWNKIKICYDYDFNDIIDAIQVDNTYKAWTYQTCTEFGYFVSTSSKNQPFTNNIPVELYYKICTSVYGKEFDEKRVEEGIKNTNELYGGLKPNVTNVIFVNGDLDPWRRLGVQEDISYNAPAKLIHGTSHCRDLLSNKYNDPEELKEARKYIKYLIKKWIGVGVGEYKINK